MPYFESHITELTQWKRKGEKVPTFILGFGYTLKLLKLLNKNVFLIMKIFIYLYLGNNIKMIIDITYLAANLK